MTERIAQSEEFARAERIVLYAALADEVPVWALAAAACASRKVLLWPRAAAAWAIEVAQADVGELRPDALGIPAPPPDREPVAVGAGDLLILPGVAFARDGVRLGRGGGHYDRLLSRSEGAVSIGVVFDIQLQGAIPTEPHDRRVDIVVTPDGVWRAES